MPKLAANISMMFQEVDFFDRFARAAEFREALARSLAYARAAGCGQLHCVAGQTDHPDAEATFAANLQWASEPARRAGVRLLLEPLNTRDNPGDFLTGFSQARRVIEKVAASVNLRHGRPRAVGGAIESGAWARSPLPRSESRPFGRRCRAGSSSTLRAPRGWRRTSDGRAS